MTLALAWALAAGALLDHGDSLAVPGLGSVALYAPAGNPTEVVLFVSGDGGWKLGVIPMAERLREKGALVAGIDIRGLLRSLEARPCAYPAGDLETLSRAVQLHRELPEYKRPILAGYSSGATLVYAALAAAPAETFAGAISLGFCPDLDIRTPPCRGQGLAYTKRAKGVGFDLAARALPVPWMVLQGESDRVCDPAITRTFVSGAGPRARLFELPLVGHGFGVSRRWEQQFVEAYRALASEAAGPTPPPRVPLEVADLQPVEVTAPNGGGRFAVLLTGDGGWAEIDKSIAAALAARGVPVVGWSSLRYFWTPRTPEAAASDLTRLIEHYAAAWRRERVLLVGYSFGADVVPFLVNRLPEATRHRVDRVGLLGLSETAAFSFHVTSWLGGGGDRRYPTAPEVDRTAAPVLCVSGSEEHDSVCAALHSPRVRRLELPGGHHFGGQYDRIADALLSADR
jgi:type IV secretory pathway VirJ component